MSAVDRVGAKIPVPLPTTEQSSIRQVKAEEDSLAPISKMPPVGLQNLGNTCYLNSALQSILSLRVVKEQVSQPSDSSDADIIRNIWRAYSAAAHKKNSQSTTTLMDRVKEFREDLIRKQHIPATYTQQDCTSVLLPVAETLGIPVVYVYMKERQREEKGCFYRLIACIIKVLRAIFDFFCCRRRPALDLQKQINAIPEAQKQFPDQPPEALYLYLYRFNQDRSKNNRPVSVPEILDLSSRYGQANLRYQLKAAPIHSGSTGGGHYWAHVRRDDGQWYCANDSSISELSGPKMSQAYGLFYERVQGGEG